MNKKFKKQKERQFLILILIFWGGWFLVTASVLFPFRFSSPILAESKLSEIEFSVNKRLGYNIQPNHIEVYFRFENGDIKEFSYDYLFRDKLEKIVEYSSINEPYSLLNKVFDVPATSSYKEKITFNNSDNLEIYYIGDQVSDIIDTNSDPILIKEEVDNRNIFGFIAIQMIPGSWFLIWVYVFKIRKK